MIRFRLVCLFCFVAFGNTYAQVPVDTISLQNITDSLSVPKDTLPGFLQKRYFHKDISLMKSREKAISNPFAITYDSGRQDVLGLSGLNRSGSISRGITIGNAQDLTVNSTLNLQLSGRLSEDLEVIAAISDDNLPIQPEGTTQQIQEFDRVFIQLVNPNYTLTAGDFELRKPDSYFLNFLKKAKGGSVQTQYKATQEMTFLNSASVAIAKGKYNRVVFSGVEGNQGPYRLRGANNETFIIVLAGTERVFVDGQLLKRGENLDYTIDYNTAELTFMPRRVITAYSRITVEFEYSDKNYARTLSVFNSEMRSKKWDVKLNYYNEQDSRNRPLLQSLTDEQKLFLSQVGDQTQNAFYSSADSVGFSENEIRYKKTDSLGAEIYVYSANPDSAIYRLNFSEVGLNRGNYIQEQTLANGRVFKWVQPISGVPQGNFEPIVLLVAPRKNSMFTYAADHRVSKNLRVGFEGAITQVDQNLFSSLDDKNNIGFAGKAIVEHRKLLKSDTANTLFLVNQLQVELVDPNFRPIEFYRPVEFNRDFNIGTNNVPSSEKWITVQSAIEKNKRNWLYYRASVFLKDTFYTGFQQGIGTDIDYRSYRFLSQVSLLNTKINNNTIQTNFLKHRFDLSKALKYVVIGIAEETEQNIYKNSNTDTLGLSSFSFKDYKTYIASPNGWLNTYRLEYSNRLDESPFQNDLRAATRSQNLLLNTELNKNPDALFGISFNYRKLDVLSDRSSLKSEENTLMRIRYDARWWDGLIVSNTFYEIGTGQEPKRAFTYLQVPAGQGVYVYRDYNNNGIKELNEFEIAKFSYEADYIRVSIVTTDFVLTKSTAFSENLLIDPYRRWSNKEGILKFLSLFSNQINFKIERKVLSGAAENLFNPFDLQIADTSLISLNTQFRESFYFKRTDPVFGMDYTVQGNRNKSLLSTGFESRTIQDHILRSRWNIASRYSINTELRTGTKSASNEAAANRNYELLNYAAGPEFAYQFSTSLRISILYQYQFQENRIGSEKSLQNKLSTEMRYNSGGKSSLQARISYIHNDFSGVSNTPVAYEMLEALQVGKNITWNANWQRNIGPNFQLSFNYDGRSSTGAKTIHAGSMQARAFF